MNKQMLRVAYCQVALLVLIGSAAKAAYTSARKYLDQPEEWFRGEEAAKIAANILSYQAPEGGWPKNIDTATQPYAGDTAALRSTYDNAATTDEIRFLAHTYSATKDPKYLPAIVKGIDYVLKGQYANGGWPQSYPPIGEAYEKYITFNDGATQRLIFFVKEIANDKLYDFVDAPLRAACKDAYERGVQCILKCQIRVNGKLTVWCAQHDEVDFSPRPARTFELVSLSGAESIGCVHVLMSVDHPSPEIIAAVDAAAAWFEVVKIPGIRVEDRPTPGTKRGFERYVVDDPSAPPMWARFYEIETNRPFFCDRDGIKKYKLSEIGIERRTGYHWLGYWPANFLASEYPAWKAKWASTATTQK